jgi:hypothetical protein
MIYSVEYTCTGGLGKSYFSFEHEAKHFAIDLAYDGIDKNSILIKEFGKTFGRIGLINNCYYFERV